MGKIIDVLTCKCPNCEKGKIFKKFGNPFLFRMSKMNTKCNECNFKFEKEPGFFFGAMFVSYALVAAEMIASVILYKFILDFPYINVLILTIVTAVFLSTINFRISRSIWIYMFYTSD